MLNEYKRGTDFDLIFLAEDENGAAEDITGYTIESQLRAWNGTEVGALIADLEAEVLVGTDGTFRVHFDDLSAAAAWPLGPAAFDFVFVIGGGRMPNVGYVLLDIIKPATEAPP